MSVFAIRHAPRCKFCRHPRITEVNLVLERWSTRRLSREEATTELEALGVENPAGGDGWKKHWSSKGHYFYESPDEARARAEKDERVAEERAQLAETIFVRILGEDWREQTPTPEQYLELVRALSVHDLFLSVKEGERVGITVDQGLKSIGEGTKRKQNEATGILLRGVADGLSQVFTKALEGDPRRELGPGEIVIEDVEEEDVP